VNVRAREYEEAIRRQDRFAWDQQLADAQRLDLERRKRRYKSTFSDLRPRIQAIFRKHGEVPPTTLREVISRLEAADATLVWTMGKWIYDRGAETDASETTIKQFMDVCPPFCCLIYAMLMSWYNFSVRDPDTGEKFDAGGNDQFMSVYLPYCDKFVTRDDQQQKCLREIADLARLQTEVMSYDDFCSSFPVAV
jgi:hypothetical protein